MALREKVLLKKATQLELKVSQKNKVNQERLVALNELLDDAYLISRPKSSDYSHRRELVQFFNTIAKQLYGNNRACPIIEEFGSFLMDLFSTGSDLDLSINFSYKAGLTRAEKIQTLRKFTKKLYSLQSRKQVSGVLPIMSAKVPVLKVVDSGTGIECDLSVENRDGILKSKIVHLICSIDERFQKLSCLMKAWAKAHNINSSKDGTLNSLSIILLVAIHLQTRDPPILPPFSAILKDGTDHAMVVKSVSNFLNYGRRNTESLAELFVSLLIKLASIEKLWPQGLCASAYQGSWISKTWDTKIGFISVEDFTERSQNVARAVRKLQVENIYKCIKLTIQHLRAFMNGKKQGPRLKDFLFGKVDIRVDDKVDKKVGKPDIVVQPIQALPKKRPADGLGGTQQAMTSNPISKVQPIQALPKKWRTDGRGGKQKTMTSKPISKAKQSWGAAQQVMTLDQNFLQKKMRYTEGWGGTPTRSWGGPATQVWVGTPTGGWVGPATQEWGGNPTGIWRGPTIQGWGNGETSQNPHFTTPSPYGNFAPHASQILPFTRTVNPVHVETPYGPFVQPVFFPPLVIPDYGSGKEFRMPQF